MIARNNEKHTGDTSPTKKRVRNTLDDKVLIEPKKNKFGYALSEDLIANISNNNITDEVFVIIGIELGNLSYYPDLFVDYFKASLKQNNYIKKIILHNLSKPDMQILLDDLQNNPYSVVIEVNDSTQINTDNFPSSRVSDSSIIDMSAGLNQIALAMNSGEVYRKFISNQLYGKVTNDIIKSAENGNLNDLRVLIESRNFKYLKSIQENNYYKTMECALVLSSINNHHAIVRYLLSYSGMSEIGIYDALWHALGHGNFEVAYELLDHLPNHFQRENNYFKMLDSIFYMALERNKMSVIYSLLLEVVDNGLYDASFNFMLDSNFNMITDLKKVSLLKTISLVLGSSPNALLNMQYEYYLNLMLDYATTYHYKNFLINDLVENLYYSDEKLLLVFWIVNQKGKKCPYNLLHKIKNSLQHIFYTSPEAFIDYFYNETSNKMMDENILQVILDNYSYNPAINDNMIFKKFLEYPQSSSMISILIKDKRINPDYIDSDKRFYWDNYQAVIFLIKMNYPLALQNMINNLSYVVNVSSSPIVERPYFVTVYLDQIKEACITAFLDKEYFSQPKAFTTFDVIMHFLKPNERDDFVNQLFNRSCAFNLKTVDQWLRCINLYNINLNPNVRLLLTSWPTLKVLEEGKDLNLNPYSFFNTMNVPVDVVNEIEKKYRQVKMGNM